MNEEQKRRWDAYNQLRAAAGERFAGRRAVEFRVVIAFWAAIAALIVLILRQEIKGWTTAHAVLTTFVATGSFYALWRWIAGLGKAHKYDHDVSRFFEGEMMKVAGLQFPSATSK
jgi:hypothetical protein